MPLDAHSPFVTVVIAARDEAGRLDACLTALRGQDFPRDTLEILVVDNGSRDATAARAAAHGVRIVSEPRVGIARARNAGVRAARAAIVAFTDADCVPDRRWLTELLAGVEDESIGCFAGEIGPLGPMTFVARYVHDRRLISQTYLLTRTPPAAATGCVAYRRAVFDVVGLFDESLPGGEDSDLFWRMVKSERFRVRYNPQARVAHAHPHGVAAFARRSYREGIALGAFRRKHGDDLPSSYTSPISAGASLARTLGGVALYPWRVRRCLRTERLPLARALAYPLLDKLASATRLAGIVRALGRREASPPTAAALQPVAHDPAAAPSIDRLTLDVAAAPLLTIADGALRERVRRELRALADGIVAAFPGSSVVLTGSLFAGEGRVTCGAQGLALASDYDLFVVTPRALHALPTVARRKLERVMRALGPLAATADVGVVWKPLVRRRMTTLGGAVIAGSTELCALLVPLAAPCALSALLQAYGHLTEAPLEPARYPDLAARALVRAARALLLADAHGRPRREWIELSSVRTVCERIAAWRPVLDDETVRAVQAAGDYLLGVAASGPRIEDHPFHCAVLRAASDRIGPASHLVAAKQMVWALGEGRRLRPAPLGPRRVLEALQTLAESWSAGAPPHAEYASVQRLLCRVATFNPHRFVVRPGEALT